ncbi:MAG: hypothetical protein SFU56_11390 [Capsulimonadales bacterium]|nr:hypothetical protein [Capsulimonadales bacterium]
MKETPAPWMIAAAAAVAVLLIGFLAWRFLAPSGDTVNSTTINDRIAKKEAKGL